MVIECYHWLIEYSAQPLQNGKYYYTIDDATTVEHLYVYIAATVRPPKVSLLVRYLDFRGLCEMYTYSYPMGTFIHN